MQLDSATMGGRVEADKIAHCIYQGSVPLEGSALRAAGFGALVLCAMEHQPSSVRFPGLAVYHAPIDDAELSMREATIACAAARFVCANVLAGRRVLVTCQQGRNRSGLVVALALHLLTGYPGRAVVNVVQRRRQSPGGPALVNPSFVGYLDALPRRVR